MKNSNEFSKWWREEFQWRDIFFSSIVMLGTGMAIKISDICDLNMLLTILMLWAFYGISIFVLFCYDRRHR